MSSSLRRICPAIFTKQLKENWKISRRSRWQLYSVPKVSPQVEKWNRVITEASQLLPQHTLDHGITDLLGKDDEIVKLLRKVVGSGHPLIQESKRLVFDNRLTFQVQGMTALLLAKAAGHAADSKSYEEAMTGGGISEQQKKLSDTIELYHAQFLTHNSVLNLNMDKDEPISKALQSTNGVATLWGDYLAANASCVLAAIKNPQVLGLLAVGVSDFTEAIFCGQVDKQGNMIPDAKSPFSVWEKVTFLEHASLLSHGCEGMMVLAGQSKELQEKARDFGKYTALAMKVSQDIEDYRQLSDRFSGAPFSLSLAPVILHLQEDHELLKTISTDVNNDVTNLDFEQIQRAVHDGNGKRKATELLTSYVNQAEQNLLSVGSNSQAVLLLQDMLHSLTNKI